ncbi:hypothetical protein ASD06_09395 [Angustibacter sp. Root456]|nr:hypothetical protein ASD06_09395 [Angustibacter sp. Root456]
MLSVVAVLGVLLIGYCVVRLVDGRGRHFEAIGTVPRADAPAPPPTSLRARQPQPATTTSPAPSVLVDESFTPARIVMSRPAVDARIQPVDVLPDGNLVIPEDVRTVGWWRSGAAPGSPVGTVVLAGHVDSASAGPGALFHLDDAPVGSRITLSGDRIDTSGTASSQVYEVVGRRRYAKAALPAASLFAQGRTPRLVVITCGGDFDPVTRHYTDNVVVFAEPVR